MARVARVGVPSVTRLIAVIMAFAGLVTGMVYSFGGLVYDIVTTGGVNAGTALAFMALPGMPVLFGIIGSIVGVAGAYAFNLAARWAGGLELDIVQ